MIEKLLIENFKCIDKLQISPGMINVVVGRNNTGKTSLLQAIKVFHDLKPHNREIEILRMSGGFERLKYLIRYNQKQAFISINEIPLKLYVDDVKLFDLLTKKIEKKEEVEKTLSMMK